MKKTLVFGTTTALMALTLGAGASLATCSREENVEAVYGPPPMEEPNEPVEVVYGPPIEEVDAPIEDVYGPPVDFFDDDSEWDEDEDEDGQTDESDESDDKDSSEAEVVGLYGVPVE